VAPSAAPTPQQAIEAAAVGQVTAPSAELGQPEEAPPPAEAESPAMVGGYYVQVGAFATPANAERARAALQDVGSVTIDQRQGASATLHRVRLGRWPTRAAAELACDMIVERGFAGAVVSESR
jgi:rare lipoprotein A